MIGFLLSLMLIVAPLQDAVSAGKQVIAANSDWSITLEQYEAIVKSFPEREQLRYADPGSRRALVNELVRIWVVCDEARKNGIAVSTDYESQRNYYQKYTQEFGSRISDESVRSFYDAHVDEYTVLSFSHILILNGNSPITPFPNLERLPYKEAENKAKEIKAMLDNGADWNEMSQKYSQDISVKDKGGAAGQISKGQIDRSLDAALFSMKVGEISNVVGSVFGFHILRLDDKKVRPFEEVRDSIRQKLIADEINRQMELKVSAAGVSIDESFFQ